ncbi:TrkH family potassium uptake protein [Mycoplasma zalophidermidis]|uniref:TrkH family potassium uptake protein n=1 Tax=Mycoplasma zalophidermidis TaxID=398174 RepID=A0ABS6DTX1_9MOLU|nr:potassium transporter TrkG [Mycoplasma zalophidermidis]MBU4689715.1 TrkH family potassium uptake protein [Mycoplasma zalophidermidis]MBU4693889.1 TrkH family potassium uptake protein [Mycoplasma zalophidermidis]MCR8966653.1 TrkH family potassium uptake protein [Mycoplasma zalophidermidis]
MKKPNWQTRWRNSRFKQNLTSFFYWLKKVSNVRIILITYLAIIILASLVLWSPITHQTTDKISYIDALFTTASAFSDTGLVTKASWNTWNMFGQAVIAFLILSGGIGIFALKIFFFTLMFPRAKNSITDMEILAHERGGDNFGQNKRVIINSVSALLIITIISGFGLSVYFYLAEPKVAGDINLHGSFIASQGDWALSFRYGFFHTISALNNAGFDIIGDNSLMSYYHNIELQMFFVILFVIGGLGYPVIYDLLNCIKIKIKYRGKNKKYVFKLITKISTSTYLITTVIGFIVILTFEASAKNEMLTFWNKAEYGNIVEKIWQSLFLTLSTRSAGFSTINIQHLTMSSVVMMSILMFIGAGPVSTGGGIRTTTIAILILALASKISGRPSVRAFRRRVDDDTVKMSFIIFSISVFLVFVGTLIVSSSTFTYGGKLDHNKFGFAHLLFEVSSAFGTSGLTVGVTSNMNDVSKLVIILIMFIGQFGISSTVLVWGGKKNYSYKYDYIHEEVMIG